MPNTVRRAFFLAIKIDTPLTRVCRIYDTQVKESSVSVESRSPPHNALIAQRSAGVGGGGGVEAASENVKLTPLYVRYLLTSLRPHRLASCRTAANFDSKITIAKSLGGVKPVVAGST